MPQPNTLLIHSDQHRFDCVGVNGHPQVRTPNMDRLAATSSRCLVARPSLRLLSPAVMPLWCRNAIECGPAKSP